MTDTQPALPVLNAERLEALDRRVRGSPGLRAVESSATVIILGGVVFGGAMLYNIVADASNKIDEAVGDATRGVQVSGVVFSDEGFQVLKADQLRKRFGAIRFMEFNVDYQRARDEYKSNGMVKALPGTAARIKHWEDVIARQAPQLLREEEKLARVHPFDVAVGSLLNNRASFWAVVGFVALVPIIPVVGSIFRDGMRHD